MKPQEAETTVNPLSAVATQEVWAAVAVRAAPAACEAVEFALMEAGALGTHLESESEAEVSVVAYFREPPPRNEVENQLARALMFYSLPQDSVAEVSLRELPHEDWLGEWKKNWQPVSVGESFIIAPPWAQLDAATTREKIVIRIEPGMAFGTGTHETTKLCLAAIEKYYAGGSFLDVGTGTGILAIAAAKMFPAARVAACDTDAEAVMIATENARLNAVGGYIAFRTGALDNTFASADCVVANLTADVIAPLMPELLGATCGRLILSGILATQEDSIRQALHRHGADNIVETTRDGEWIAIVV